MSETTELADKLKREGEKLADFFSGLDTLQWNQEVYTEGSVWTVRNVLAHLMTSERAFVKLFEQIRQGGEGVSDDFSIDRYNAHQQGKTRELSSAELLDQYRDWRAQMIVWVSHIDDADLARKGRHPFLGVTSLREMIKMVYLHNQIHFRDMRAAIK